MIITGPIKTSNLGVNKISDGSCCPQYSTFDIKLRPNEADKVLTRLVWTDATCGSVITEYGFIGGLDPYVDPLAPQIPLSQSDPDEVCRVVIDLCGCGLVGSTFSTTLVVHYTVGGNPGTQTFNFDFEVIDISLEKVIGVTSANFWDCINDCGRINDIVPISNPLNVDLTVTFPNPVTSFTYYVDGNILTPVAGVYTVVVPGLSTVMLQVANLTCTYATEYDSSIAFSYCGITENVPVDHRIVQCNGCGLDCDGISIATSALTSIISDPSLVDPSQWSTNITFGSPTVALAGGKLSITGGAGGYNEVRLQYQTPVTFPLNSPLTFNWKLTTGQWTDQSTSNQIYMFLPGGGWGPQINLLGVPVALPNIQPFKTYTGTFTMNPWTAPAVGVGNGPVLVIQVFNQIGKTYEILEFEVEAIDSFGAVDLDCSDLDAYNETAIGDSKTATYKLYYEKGFQDGVELFFNPKLFGDTCDSGVIFGATPTITAPPSTGWQTTINSLWINDGIWHPLTLFGMGTAMQTQRNFDVAVKLIDAYQFQLRFQFYITMDINDWMRAFIKNNPDRLIKSIDNNPTDLDNTPQSVFNTIKSLCAGIVIRDPNIQVPFGNTTRPYVCGDIKQVFFTARFWNLGLYNGNSEMQNPTWTFSRTVGNVTSLSTLEKTSLNFSIQYFNSVDKIVLWLFNRRAQNTSQNFFNNYDSSRVSILTNPSTGILANKILGPSTSPTLVAPNTYEITCMIDKNLDPFGDYYIGAICYSNSDDIVNSFLYRFNPVTNGPEVCCDLNISSRWDDYNLAHYSDCHTTAPKEPFIHQLQITGGPLQTCMVNDWKMDPTKLWTDYLTTCGIKVYQKVQNYPAAGTDAYFLYVGYQQTRNTAYIDNWPNNIPGSVWSLTDAGGNLSSLFRYRSRYESNLLPINVYSSNQSTPFQWSLVGGQAPAWIAANNITFDWSDKDIFFHYTFDFVLSWLPTNPQLQINYIARLHPCGFEPNPAPFGSLLAPLSVTGFNSSGSNLISNVICSGVYDYLEVDVIGFVPDGTCMATIDFQPYGINNLKEEENSTPPGNPYFFPQACVEIYDVQNFSSGVASFKIKMSQLPVGEYQICAISIPY